MSEPYDHTNRKLRILHVLRAPLGGLFRHVLDLTREQIARGHDVGLVVDSLTGGDRAVEQLAALEPQLALGIKRMPMVRHPQIKDIANVFKVEAYARRLKVDVLHGHGSKGGLYARLAGVLLRKGPMIRGYTPHGGSFNHVASPLVQTMYMRVEKLLSTCTDVLLFESIYIANCFRERVGDTQALVRIVQNGISPAEFVPVAPNSDAADLLYVGELRSAKGIDTLIDATAILSRRLGRPLKLICVGSGPDQPDLEERARSRGISERVTFPGAMAARSAFALGRILVVPSRAESLPYVVLEAAGAQIPMIATNVGGISEIFGPYRDRLICCDDAVVLAATIQQIMEADPAAVKAQAAELAGFVTTRFAIAIMADAVISGYRDAFTRRALPTGVTKRYSALPQ